MVVMICAVLCMGVGFFLTPHTALGKNLEDLRIGVGIDADTLNPLEHTTAIPQNLSELIHDTLLRVNPDGKLEPLLAENYAVSDDGLTWTVKLRAGILFSDGSPLDAQALKSFFDAILNPKVRMPMRVVWGALKEAVVVDDLTLQLLLKTPFAPFDQALALVCPLPRHLLEPYDADKIRQSPIGAGPFKLSEWKKGDRIVLTRNEKYWGKKPTVDKISFLIVPDTTTRIAMLRAGQLDMAYSPTPVDIRALEADPKTKVDRPLSTRFMFVGINCQKAHLKDPRVRQAFNYAVDRKAIASKLMFDVAKPLDAPVPPALFGYTPMAEPFEYNPGKAKTLLKEAGFPQDQVVKLITPTGRYTNDKQVAEAVQSYLQDVGIKVELRAYDWPTYMAMVTKPLEQSEIELFLFGYGAPYMDADFPLVTFFSSFVHPPKGLGAVFYSNPEYDKAVIAARQTVDQTKRKALMKDAAAMVWKDAATIWLYVEPYSIAYQSDLKGLITLPLERIYPTWITR